MANPLDRNKPDAPTCEEEDRLLRSLREHGQVVESESENPALGPGQTHVYVKPSGKRPGKLIEKRKSFF